MVDTRTKPTDRRATPARSVTGATPAPVRRRGALGRVTAVQIVAVEIAALVVLAAVGGAGANVVALVVAAVVAIPLLVAVFAPTPGGWWYEGTLVRRRWRRRRRVAAAVRPDRIRDHRLAPLAGLAPGLAVRGVDDRGTAIGVGQDADGWFAALSVAVPPDARGAGAAGLPLDRLARLFHEAPLPVTAMSVTSYTHAAPSPLLPPQTPAALSYRELIGADQIVSDQEILVAIRLGHEDASAAAADRGGGLDGVERAIATVVGRVSKVLGAAEINARVLDPESLVAALATACHPQVTARSGEPGEETWTAWRTGELTHTCLQLTTWPNHRPGELFAALARVPADLVSVTITLQPTGADVTARCLVRVAAQAAGLPAAVTEVTTLASRAGAHLRRLDGRHGPAVYATAPTAGVLR